MPPPRRRVYSADELALFAQYRDQRAICRPLGCLGGEACWVELGPPGISGHAHACAYCGDCPRVLPLHILRDSLDGPPPVVR